MRLKIIFGHRHVIWIKNAPPHPYDVWARSFIVGAWEVIWPIWSHGRLTRRWRWVGGGTEFRNKHQASPKVQVFLQIEIFSADEFRHCPEVRVCGFGSSPRFGDELMEIGVAAGRSVALG